MKAIDNWLIGKVERGCHRFQRLTGYTNFWLMGKVDLCIVALVVGQLLHDISSGDTGRWLAAKFGFWGAALDIVPLVLFLNMGLNTWKTHETMAFARLLSGLCNPSKIGLLDIVLRFAYLCFTLGILAGVIILALDHQNILGPSDVLMVLLGTHLFLLACDPLPPCAGKLGEWLAAISTKREGSAV